MSASSLVSDVTSAAATVVSTGANVAATGATTSASVGAAVVAGAVVATPIVATGVYAVVEGIMDRLPSMADFFMGESKSRAEELQDNQKKLDREARRADHKAWMADQQAAAYQARADARARNPEVQEKLAAGLDDLELQRHLNKSNQLANRAKNISDTASHLSLAADGMHDVASSVSILEAATLTTSVMEETNEAMGAIGDAESVADRLSEARDTMKDNQYVIQRALGGRNAQRSNNVSSDQMRQYRDQAREAIIKRQQQERHGQAQTRSPAVSLRSSSSYQPERVPVPLVDRDIEDRLRRLGDGNRP
jgi:hypothetical protein